MSVSNEERLIDEIGKFAFDPRGWVDFVFPWGDPNTELAEESGPRVWQAECLDRIGEKLREGGDLGAVIREAVASGHGIGKSALVSWLVLWALDTWPDTKGVVTANTEAQLRTKTWPEVAKWHRLRLTKDWFEFTATSVYSKQLDHEKTWRIDAIPWSDVNTEAFAGLHNKKRRILVVFDEASAISDLIWEVTEGALTDDETQIIWVAFGNPTRNTGRFRECFRRFRKRWHVKQIDSRTVEGTNRKQIEEWENDYGEDSDFFKVRVRGEFPAQSIKQFISETAVRAAQKRHLRKRQYDFAPIILACDPAWEGDDKLVIGFRQGLYSETLCKLEKNDNDVMVANRLARYEDDLGADAVFVDGGYGTGIISAGKTMGRNWTIVWFGEKPYDEGYLNKRAEMWGQMKKWLDEGGVIDDSDDLFYDLIGPETVPRLDGKIQLESKETMKKRGLPSPDCGDQLALTFAHPVTSRKQQMKSRGQNVDQVQGGDIDPLA